MKSFEFTGKSVEDARKKGLAELGLNMEDVDIQILSEGGFFKKARIIINVDEKPVASFKPAQEVKVEEPKVEEVKQEPKNEEKEPEMVANETSPEGNRTVEIEDEKEPETIQELQVDEEPKEEVVKVVKKDRNSPKTLEEIEEQRRLFNEKHFENNSTTVEFVEGLLKVMELQAEVELEEKRDASQITIKMEDPRKVIGHKGEALSAIQYLSNIIESAKNPQAKRVVVDAGEYKQKREESLRALAIKIAGKVEATGRPYKLEPMSAFERRIVHTELQNYSSVETHSEGVEPRRRIIVTKKK